MKACAVILGGGSGTRMGAKQNKIFLPLRGVPAIVRAAAPFTGLCAEAVVAARPEELEDMRALLRRYGLDSFVKKVVPAAVPGRNPSVMGWTRCRAIRTLS